MSLEYKPGEQPSDPNWVAPIINKWTLQHLRDLEMGFGRRGCWPICIEMRQWLENNFDEQFKFWYQDNDYAFTLQKFGFKHALITKSKVKHLLSKSHNLIDRKEKYNMTDGLITNLQNKWFKK